MGLWVSLAVLLLNATAVQARSIDFQHIVVMIQENRSPDNMFHALCAIQDKCSTKPDSTQYNIQVGRWLDKTSKAGVTDPTPVDLKGAYTLEHFHSAYVVQCDLDPNAGACRMDGAQNVPCHGQCPAKPPFAYVDNSDGVLNPYLTMIGQFGWANYFFATDQGPSFPSHQYLFTGTSADSQADDNAGYFAAENPSGHSESARQAAAGKSTKAPPPKRGGGCAAPAKKVVQVIDPNGVEAPGDTIPPCFEHATVSDLLDANHYTWRYYAPDESGIWTAPNAIDHICVPVDGQCTGTSWTQNVDLVPADVLTDIANCQLRNVSWVAPTGQNSDHPRSNQRGGPSWIASVVNAIGKSPCKNADQSSYWNSTAIVVLWDEWGGWYDHEAPKLLPYPQGGYQLGFRVPMIFISAYTKKGYISNVPSDFGSIVRFIEHDFGVSEGVLTFSDARSASDLKDFYDRRKNPRRFRIIPAPLKAEYFLKDKSKPTAPDDD